VNPVKSYLNRDGEMTPPCWCRKCKQNKREDEMFTGVIHPDGIGRGMCKECRDTLDEVKNLSNNEKKFFGGALALLICTDGNDRIHNGRVIRSAREARGYVATAVVWLRDPTPEERGIVVSCLRSATSVEMRAHPVHSEGKTRVGF
jgi:hypothetical protein